MLTLDHLRTVLQEYAEYTGHTIDLLLIGGLAMLAYGHPSRATIDVDGELTRPCAGFGGISEPPSHSQQLGTTPFELVRRGHAARLPGSHDGVDR